MDNVRNTTLREKKLDTEEYILWDYIHINSRKNPIHSVVTSKADQRLPMLEYRAGIGWEEGQDYLCGDEMVCILTRVVGSYVYTFFLHQSPAQLKCIH